MAFASSANQYGRGEFKEIDAGLVGDTLRGSEDDAGLAENGPVGADNMTTFPVSPTRQAEMRARAAAFGLPSGSDKLDEPPAPAPVRTAMSTSAPPLPDGRPRIFDASEGTSLDPLRDKTYDLMTAKSVPVLKALPPMAVVQHY